MAYIYYNQRSYGSVPYPHSSKVNATIQSSGCGVCCALMALENLTGNRIRMEEMAQFSIANGGRDAYGTNLFKLLDAIKQKYAAFDYRVTGSRDELIAHLGTGGGAIANVGGDRGSYKGIFCSTGHFVFVAGLTVDKQAIVLDPDKYEGKYSGWRATHVTVNGNELYCDPVRLDEDCSNKSPRYYLVAGGKSTPVQPSEPTAGTQYRIGDHITFSTCYTTSTAGTDKAIPVSKMAVNHGIITSIAAGAVNPYLLDNGLCWVNDGDIRGYYNQKRTGTVITNNMPLNLRSDPSAQAGVIGSIPKGASVQIVSEASGWYKVAYQGLSGYASKQFIQG